MPTSVDSYAPIVEVARIRHLNVVQVLVDNDRARHEELGEITSE
jgi:hypothetical protein